jgi:hypothetical protein
MEQQPDNRELLEIVENSLTQFNEAMQRRDDLGIRIGRRTTQIIRVGAITVSLLSFAVVYLTMALKQDMNNMSGYMEQMTGLMQTMSTAIVHIPGMAESMHSMNTSMAALRQDVSGMNTSVSSMDRQMDHLRNMDLQMDFLRVMSADMSGLRQDVSYMNQSVAGMNHQMGNLNGSVGAMGYNVNRMAAPAKMMPFP